MIVYDDSYFLVTLNFHTHVDICLFENFILLPKQISSKLEYLNIVYTANKNQNLWLAIGQNLRYDCDLVFHPDLSLSAVIYQ